MNKKIINILFFFLFSSIVFGQIVKSPKNLDKAVKYLNTNTSDSIKKIIKNCPNDTIENISYPFGGKFKTIFDWTNRENYGSNLVKYLDKKGVTNHQIEVILIAFKNYLNHKEFNEQEVLEPFQKLELKWKNEDKVRYTTDSLRGNYIPKDLNDSFETLNKIYSDSAKVLISKLNEDEYVLKNYRFGMGLWMRNNWQLWGGSRLTKFFKDNNIRDPESMSSVILECYHRYLKGENIEFEKQIKDNLEWEEKAKINELKRKEKEQKEKETTFNELKIGDLLEFNYNYEFATNKQEEKWLNDTCLAKGILIEKDDKNLKIKVKVIESCDRKGIVIYNNDNVRVYDSESKEWIRPKRKVVVYLKKGKSNWFDLKNWDKE